jgi:hypothetical protein
MRPIRAQIVLLSEYHLAGRNTGLTGTNASF